MIIELTNEYRARTIPLNVVLERLEEVHHPKTGEFVRMDWKERGFYATIGDAIRAIPGDVVLDDRVASFDAAVARIDALADQMEARL